MPYSAITDPLTRLRGRVRVGARWGLKPEVLQQLLGGQVTPAGEDRPPLVQQSGVVRRPPADLLAEFHDLSVEVIELATRTTLEALEGRRAICAVGWEVACQPAAKEEVADWQRKRRHETKGARSATLIETEPTALGRLDTFPNRRNR